MEITLHPNLGAVGRTAAAKPVVNTEPVATAASDASQAETDVAFENVRALNSALRETPVSRADVVKRATELIGDVNYPPRETIQQISNLLAMRLYSDDASDAAQGE